MQLATPELADQVAEAARLALTRAGGVDLARRAEADPELRRTTAGRLISELGVGELRIQGGLDELLAAGELCRAAGSVAFPFPLPSLLARPDGVDGLVVVGPGGRRADHADLWEAPACIELGAGFRKLAEVGPAGRQPLAPFVTRIALAGEPSGTDADRHAAAWLLLTSWSMLGAAEQALRLTVKHVREREQFGAPLAKLQSVRFRVADVAGAVRGLSQLARHTAWRFHRYPEDSTVDALALRVVAQETVQQAFRVGHQLHGATGFCDEHDLSVLSRHVQPLVRLPLDHERSVELLTAEIDRHGFDGLFGRYR